MLPYDQKTAFDNAVRLTKDPNAYFRINDAYTAVETLGRLMSKCADQEKIEGYVIQMLNSLRNPEVELNNILSSPEYVAALAGTLAVALIHLGKKLGEKE
jgi:hypothetical protein